MATLVLTVSLTEDGVTVPGFPLTRTVTSTETSGKNTYTRASGGGYVELPLAELGAINFAIVTTDQDITLRFNDQSDAGLPLDANGIIILATCDIPTGATNKIEADNSSGNTATLTSYIGGA